LIAPSYPTAPAERDRWILQHRGGRAQVDPWKPAGFFVEDERSASLEVIPVATILLTNRECPWRCLMCDLWRHTLQEPTPIGAIPAQLRYALDRLPPARAIKLYNSGSFFDRQAIPPADHEEIALLLCGFERVIVECHPVLVNDSATVFRERLGTPLEVAMGLETVHPEILPRLNKRMTLDSFARAAERLLKSGIALRAFVLVKPPFLREEEAVEWAVRSIEFAYDCGATAVSLIPTRSGNGALDALAEVGDFAPPRLSTLESAHDAGIRLQRGRVFADLWDLERFASCRHCFAPRLARLRQTNLQQIKLPRVQCDYCRANV
jgi:radical SAM enzyme (TIGR01210 family)